jgi:hypothetical protein
MPPPASATFAPLTRAEHRGRPRADPAPPHRCAASATPSERASAVNTRAASRPTPRRVAEPTLRCRSKPTNPNHASVLDTPRRAPACRARRAPRYPPGIRTPAGSRSPGSAHPPARATRRPTPRLHRRGGRTAAGDQADQPGTRPGTGRRRSPVRCPSPAGVPGAAAAHRAVIMTSAGGSSPGSSGFSNSMITHGPHPPHEPPPPKRAGHPLLNGLCNGPGPPTPWSARDHCPAGHTRPITPTTRTAAFGALCRTCPLRARCTKSQTGRKIVLHEHDTLSRQARRDWKTNRHCGNATAGTDPTSNASSPRSPAAAGGG